MSTFPFELPENIIRDADEMINGLFRFNNPWDMEQCKEPFPLYRSRTDMSPNGDQEWVYQFSRMEYLHKVLMAYIVTEDEKYAKLYGDITEKFFSKNHPPKNKKSGCISVLCAKVYGKCKQYFKLKPRYNTYRTLDSAIRNYALCVDWYVARVYGKKPLLSETNKTRMESELDYPLYKFDDVFYHKSNWGLIILSLNITCKVMLFDKNALCDFKLLEELLSNQITPWGAHAEGAMMYHMQVLICLLRLIYRCKKAEVKVPESIRMYCENMVRYAYQVALPNYHQVMYGDSDDTSIETVLFIACEVLHITKLDINYSGKFDGMLLFEFFDPEDTVCIPDENSGSAHKNYLVGNGIWVFDNDDFSIRAFNEPIKFGHKHIDNGSVNLWFQGNPIFCDCGRYTYVHDDRMYFRSPFSHNILLTDNAYEYLPIAYNSQNVPTTAYLQCLDISGMPNGACMSYSVFNTHKGQIKIIRYFIMINSAFVTIDAALSEFSQKAQQIWNFVTPLDAVSNGYRFSIKNRCEYRVFSCANSTVKKGYISRAYNEREEIVSHLEYETAFRDGIAVIPTVVAPCNIVSLLKGDTITVGNTTIRLNRTLLAVDPERAVSVE